MENIGFARKTAGDPRAGTSALQSRGRRAGVSAHATHLSSRLGSHAARGHARARRAASGVRARAGSRRRRRDARAHHARHRHRRVSLVVSARGVRLLRPLRPRRLLRRACVRRASASGRSRARPANEHGRACGPPDARSYCRRNQCRARPSGIVLAEDKRQAGVSTCQRIKNARDFALDSAIRSKTRGSRVRSVLLSNLRRTPVVTSSADRGSRWNPPIDFRAKKSDRAIGLCFHEMLHRSAGVDSPALAPRKQ